MRALLTVTILLLPTLALANPACQQLSTLSASCAKGKQCSAFLTAMRGLPNCDGPTEEAAFDVLSHRNEPAAKKLFCSAQYKNHIAHDASLSEVYAYAYKNYADDPLVEETPDTVTYYKTMTDCRKKYVR